MNWLRESGSMGVLWSVTASDNERGEGAGKLNVGVRVR